MTQASRGMTQFKLVNNVSTLTHSIFIPVIRVSQIRRGTEEKEEEDVALQ